MCDICDVPVSDLYVCDIYDIKFVAFTILVMFTTFVITFPLVKLSLVGKIKLG